MVIANNADHFAASSAFFLMTPPNVLGAPKPWSSVMMSKTLGGFFGGTTRGGHGVDSEAFCLITPSNFGSGGGNCFPVIVVVASGEPGTAVVCCASAESNPTVRLMPRKRR